MTQLRTIDTAALAQLSKALVGFDRYFTAPHHQNGNYPPHNIVKYDDTHYGIEVAVAGFSKEEITVEVDQDQLMITGKKFVPEEESDFNDAVYDFIEKVTGKDAKEWSKDNYDDFNGEFADYAADNTDSSQEVNNPKRKISKKEAAARAENLGKISSTLKNVAKAIGEHTVAGKAAAIAAVTIDTYMSATAAFKSLAGIPVVGPVLGAVAAAAAIVAGLKNVKAILAVKTPNIPAGSSEPGFVDIPSPSMPSVGGGGALPDIGGGGAPDTGGDGGGSRRAPSGGGGGSSVRAYVIQTDISNAQQREQEIQNRARFQ